MKYFLKISCLSFIFTTGMSLHTAALAAPSASEKTLTSSKDEKIGDAITLVVKDAAWEQLRTFAQNGDGASVRKSLKSFKAMNNLAKMNLTLSNPSGQESFIRFKKLLKDLKKLSRSKESKEILTPKLVTSLAQLKACLFYLYTLLSKEDAQVPGELSKTTIARLAALKIIRERQAQLKK